MLSRTNRKLTAVAGAAVSIGITAYVMYDMVQESNLKLVRVTQLNQLLLAQLENQNYGYAAVDRSGRIVEWNHALEVITGYTKKEMIGSTLEKIMRLDDWQKHNSAFDKVMRMEQLPSGVTTLMQCVIKIKDGKLMSVRASIRMYEIGEGAYRTRYATAHIDKAENVDDVNLITPEVRRMLNRQRQAASVLE
jgi:PAS domain S-box-containing protein